MIFHGAGEHTQVLQRFEEDAAGVTDLANFEIEVEVHPTFQEAVPAVTAAHKRSPAAYLQSRDLLMINDAEFTKLDESGQLAVLAHELGHAYRHRQGISAPGAEDCFLADLQAIHWGLGEALVRRREHEYGDEYARLLRNVSGAPHSKLVGAYRMWQMRRNAGLA